MRTIPLGNTGEPVSQLSLGCMLMGTLTDEDTSFGMLDHFVDHGGTFIDTANAYCWWNNPGSHGGESEELIGRWFARTGRRDDVFLATKGSGLIDDLDAVWGADGRPDWSLARQHFDGAGGDNLRRSVDDSLRRLQTDHIDLYYVHVDDRSTPIEETLQALARRRGGRKGPAHRLVQRPHLATGADPAGRCGATAGRSRSPSSSSTPTCVRAAAWRGTSRSSVTSSWTISGPSAA